MTDLHALRRSCGDEGVLALLIGLHERGAPRPLRSPKASVHRPLRPALQGLRQAHHRNDVRLERAPHPADHRSRRQVQAQGRHHRAQHGKHRDASATELGYVNVPDGILCGHVSSIGSRAAQQDSSSSPPAARASRMSALLPHGVFRAQAGGHRPGRPHHHLRLAPFPATRRRSAASSTSCSHKGAEVIYERMHRSARLGPCLPGGAQDDATRSTKPKFFIPVHGERRMLHKHADDMIRGHGSRPPEHHHRLRTAESLS